MMQIERLVPKTTDVGGIPIARLLPNKGKQPIGAWCFLDHAGPARFGDDENGMQVGRHPHTNLQTFTWMLDGEVLHNDSIGNRQIIRKNQVNLMTAGTGASQGISHTEQSIFVETGGLSNVSRALQAVQLWLALPMDKEIERSFHHYPTLPTWTDNGVNFTLTTGSYQYNDSNYQAPTLQYSPSIALYVEFTNDSDIKLNLQNGFEYGILVVTGELEFDGQTFVQDELARIVFDKSDNHLDNLTLTLRAKIGTRLMLIGGEPLRQPVLIWWNFVDKDKAGLEQSIIDWNNQHERFGDIHIDMKRLVAPPLPDGFKG